MTSSAPPYYSHFSSHLPPLDCPPAGPSRTSHVLPQLQALTRVRPLYPSLTHLRTHPGPPSLGAAATAASVESLGGGSAAHSSPWLNESPQAVPAPSPGCPDHPVVVLQWRRGAEPGKSEHPKPCARRAKGNEQPNPKRPNEPKGAIHCTQIHGIWGVAVGFTAIITVNVENLSEHLKVS